MSEPYATIEKDWTPQDELNYRPGCKAIERAESGNQRAYVFYREGDKTHWFGIDEWMGKSMGFHPIHVGNQSGLLSSAVNRFEQWKRQKGAQ